MPRLENPKQYRNATEDQLLRVAHEVIEKELENSSILSREIDEARFDLDELMLGKVVGRGGFCVVRDINSVKLKTIDQLNVSSSSVKSEDRRAMASREHLARRIYSRKGDPYVLKQVEAQLLDTDKVTFLKGLIDLSLEIHYLSALNHPHILKLKGLSVYEPHETLQSFVILDKLSETLTKRLNTWMHQTRATQGLTGFFTGGKRRKTGIRVEKMLCAHDIADALEYLHSKKIIYRDLKPDNIGFSGSGVLKIFDFGLAKELRNEDYNEEEKVYYNMTAFTGSIRYMAPEVGLHEPYNEKADVYSWSMLFWYMMALEPPFGLYSPKMHIDRVFRKHYRPAIKEKWSPVVQKLLREAWSDDVNSRPGFGEIMQHLKDEVESVDPQVATFMGEGSQRRQSE